MSFRQLLQGFLFVEGPLENNPSPVYWASRLYGTLKHWLYPKLVACDKPTHLFRTDAHSQLKFFLQLDNKIKLRHWKIYETGWPYANGGPIKSMIANIARIIGGKSLFGVTFGNRFSGIFQYTPYNK